MSAKHPRLPLVLGIAMIAVAATSAHAENCELKEIASLSLTESGDHLLVPAIIGGKNVNFVLELAYVYSGITDKASTGLSLEKSTTPGWLNAEYGETNRTLIAVPAMKIDQLTVRNFKLLEIPAMSDADGVLGLDIMSANDLELDLAHNRANIFSRDHCAGNVVYWDPPGGAISAIPLKLRDTESIQAQMTVDTRLLTVGITTANRSWMGMNVAHRVFGIDEHSTGVQKLGTDDSGRPVYRYPFHEIDTQGLKIENPDIVIVGQASDPECNYQGRPVMHSAGETLTCFGGADLRLGLSVLRKLHLFFAFGEQVLYVTPA